MRRAASLRAASGGGPVNRGEAGGEEPGSRRKNPVFPIRRGRGSRHWVRVSVYSYSGFLFPLWVPRGGRSHGSAGQDFQGLPELPATLSLRRSRDGARTGAQDFDSRSAHRSRATGTDFGLKLQDRYSLRKQSNSLKFHFLVTIGVWVPARAIEAGHISING